MIQYVRREDKLKAEMNVKAASILLSIAVNNSWVFTKNKPEAFCLGFQPVKKFNFQHLFPLRSAPPLQTEGQLHAVCFQKRLIPENALRRAIGHNFPPGQ